MSPMERDKVKEKLIHRILRNKVIIFIRNLLKDLTHNTIT
jgi:hypothetical protein